MHDQPLRIFIGYDEREDDAYKVCVHSLRKHSSKPLAITPLKQPALRRAGLYRRAELPGKIDWVDGKPFSTAFAFSRFLVPALAGYEGWALFCDVDFLFRTDVAALFETVEEKRAIMCVHHDYRPLEQEKMDGVPQAHYFRKNWSSLVLWNCGHPAHASLTVDQVSLMPGAWLHRFEWLSDIKLIGSIEERWNWLEGWSRVAKTGEPAAVHFTRGVPSMPGHEDADYAAEWFQTLSEATAGMKPDALYHHGHNGADIPQFDDIGAGQA